MSVFTTPQLLAFGATVLLVGFCLGALATLAWVSHETRGVGP